jgi:hypothetical protein
MWVANVKTAVLSIITGGGKWVEIPIAADPLYQQLLLTAEKSSGGASKRVSLRACSEWSRHGVVDNEYLEQVGRVRRDLSSDTGCLCRA